MFEHKIITGQNSHSAQVYPIGNAIINYLQQNPEWELVSTVYEAEYRTWFAIIKRKKTDANPS